MFCWYFSSFKNGHNQKTYSKAQSFEVFQMVCWEKGGCGTFATDVANALLLLHLLLKSLSSASFYLFPLFFWRKRNLAFTTKQIQMWDNEWAEDRDCRHRAVLISQAAATQIAFAVCGNRWQKDFAIICTVSSNYGVRIYPLCLSSSAHSAEVNRKN